jgi:hypothetical protein
MKSLIRFYTKLLVQKTNRQEELNMNQNELGSKVDIKISISILKRKTKPPL